MALMLRPLWRPNTTTACASCVRRWAVSQARWSSTEVIPPPLLAKMKGDLKAAMKAKDAPRLAVIRAVVTDYNNASKTATPITSDMQVLSLLRKRKGSSEEAEREALSLKREDIATKQLAEIQIMDEYAGSISLMTEDDIRLTIQKVVDQVKSAGGDTKAGQILKEIFKPGGLLDGKPVEKSQVAKLVNSTLSGK